MKELFKGYNKKTEKELKEIWNNSIFVFDTNILLNLYRYSADTRNSITKLIEHFKDRIILPYQSAFEFNKNRYEVIASNETLLTKFLTNLQNIQNEINSKTQHPFLSNRLNKSTDELFKKIREEALKNQEDFKNYYNDDPIYNKINDLFSGKISSKFSDAEIEQICKEGEKRYTNKIPPGFEDAKKSDNKFGDLIIWKEIIEIAKANKNNIIFISDDKKKDWYWILETGSKTIGPHPKLIEEFFELTGFDFHILTSERFLSLGEEFSKVKPATDAIEEIEAAKKITDSHLISYNQLFHDQAKLELNIEKSFELQKRYARLRDLTKISDSSLKNIEFYKYLEDMGNIDDLTKFANFETLNNILKNEGKRNKRNEDDDPETSYALVE